MRSRELAATIFLIACGPTTSSGKFSTAKLKPWLERDECKPRADGTTCPELCALSFEVPSDQSVTACRVEISNDVTKLFVTYGKREERNWPVDGRRPVGLREPSVGITAGGYLAWSAQLEAASVVAFARIHDQLVREGATEALRALVEAARQDEVEHARVVGELARAHGVVPQPPVIDDEPQLDVLERAIDNVVEGCVGETVAALRAAMLAVHATDASVRRAYARIADDEIRHAALAFELADYYDNRITLAERTRVRAAYDAAAANALVAPHHPGLIELGLSERALATAVSELLAHRITWLAA